MKIVIGTSTNNDAISAVNEATGGITNPSFLLFTCSFGNLPEIVECLNEKYPDAKKLGTGGTGFYNGKDYGKTLVITAFFDDAIVITGVLRSVSTMPLRDIQIFQKNIRDIQPGKDNTVCWEYCASSEEKLTTTMSSAIDPSGIPLLGGSIFGYEGTEIPLCCVDDKLYDDACGYALIKNKNGKIKVYRENIYSKNDNIAHIATKVNRSNRELIELDGRPVADVYSSQMDIPKNQIIDSVMKHPMCRQVGEESYVASMKELGPNGSFINYKQINQNDTIYFMKLADYKEIMNTTLNKIHNDFPKVSLVLSVDCIYRYLLFQSLNYLPEYLASMHSIGNHMGYVGGGEQFINQHMNQTLVCAVFE